MKTKIEWHEILKTDPDFERLVKMSGAVRVYYTSIPKKPIVDQERRAVATFMNCDMVRGQLLGLVIQKYQSDTRNLRDALLYWFRENWSRWMEEHD